MTFDPRVLYGGSHMERLLGIRPDSGQGSYFTGQSLRAGQGMGYLGMTSIGANDNFAIANQTARSAIMNQYNSWNSVISTASSQLTSLQSAVSTLQSLAAQGSPTAAAAFTEANSVSGSVSSAVQSATSTLAGFKSQIDSTDQRDRANQIFGGSDWVYLQNQVMPGVKSSLDGNLATINSSGLGTAASKATAAIQTAKMEISQQQQAAAMMAPAPAAAPTVNVPPPPAAPQTDYMAQFMEMMRSQMSYQPQAPSPPPSASPPIPSYTPIVPVDYSMSAPAPAPAQAPSQPQMSPAEILYFASQQAQQQPQSFDQIVYDVPADQFVSYDYRPSQGGYDTSLLDSSRGGEMFGMGADVGSILSQIDAARAKIQGALAAVPALAPLVKKPEPQAPAPVAAPSGKTDYFKYAALAGAAWLGYRALTKRGKRR